MIRVQAGLMNGSFSVRAKVYFLLTDTTGQQNLMTQLNGETPQILAEGIDSVRFQAGGAGGAIGGPNYDEKVAAAKNITGSDPARVAQVVKKWVATDG